MKNVSSKTLVSFQYIYGVSHVSSNNNIHYPSLRSLIELVEKDLDVFNGKKFRSHSDMVKTV